MIRRISQSILLYVAILFPAALSQTCDSNRHVDGCSAPDFMAYQETFRRACNRHDMCYLCGNVSGLSRLECDERFLDRMNAACGPDKQCLKQARLFYKAVRAVGWRHYEEPSHTDCRQPWARYCEM